MRVIMRLSGTIAGVFPSMPTDSERDPWGPDHSREIARTVPKRPRGGSFGMFGDADPLPSTRPEGENDGDDHEEIPVVPVRRELSLAIGGFAALLGAGLIVGAQSSGPDARAPYAIVIFGVQVLFVLAWAIATRPPATAAVAGVAVLGGLYADYRAVNDEPRLWPLLLVVVVTFVAAVVAQQIRATDRRQARDALGAGLLVVVGPVAYASLIMLTRKPIGTQAIGVCLAAAAVALLVARVTDAVFAKPRIAPQVPRGATGVILGAMLGTLAAAGLGSVLVLPFTPAKGAVLGLVAAGAAVLLDLAVDYTEAGRSMAGDAPTFWPARHMQGPLGAFALVAPVAYGLTAFYLS
jgi:hypothetical protein